MKYFILLFLIFYGICNAQIKDLNNDGIFDLTNVYPKKYDYTGDGNIGYKKFPACFNPTPVNNFNFSNLNFSLFWASYTGMFGNCWDGLIGNFDGDTLLDIAGYTFSPNKFYIYEQSSVKPDSFLLVYEYSKAESGSFGPITSGDTDNDGKIEIITADLSTITRIYIFENNGDNNYLNLNTQSTLTHTSDGQNGRSIYTGDMNKNGKKEIICSRGASDGGTVRIWEHTGVQGSNTYNNIYTYTTPTYIFGQGGFGDSDNDGYDELFITYGAGAAVYPTYIRRIEFDSATASFVHLMHTATSVGMPASYQVKDVNGDGIKELIHTGNSNGMAAFYVHRSTGANSYLTIDSVFESSDNNSMLTSDIKLLQGNTYPSILLGSFNGRLYVYEYSGSAFVKQFEKLDYPSGSIRRVYWTQVLGVDSYFNTRMSGNSDGTFYIFRKTIQVSVSPAEKSICGFYLYNNYPNPFNALTNVKFQMLNSGFVTLKIFDVMGKEIATLMNEQKQQGIYEVRWNAADFPSGIYFYKLSAGNFTDTKRMILIK